MSYLRLNLLPSAAELFFSSGYRYSLVLILVALWAPQMMAGGLLSVMSAHLFAHLTGLKNKPLLEAGHFIYNPFLVGLALGYRFELTLPAAGLMAVAGIITLIITIFLAQAIHDHFNLPVLSLPFVLVSVLFYLAANKYPQLQESRPLTGSWLQLEFMPHYLAGYFKALGTVLFSASTAVGLIISLLLLLHSRFLFLLSVLGYYFGTLLNAVFLGSFIQAHQDPNNFNLILTAMAVGGIFLTPSRASCLQAIVGVGLALVVMNALSHILSGLDVPVFTLPFLAATWIMVYVTRILGGPMIPSVWGRTPEESLENTIVQHKRYPREARRLHLPVAGDWLVWQGIDGNWTHQGINRYAFDLVITDPNGSTFAGSGLELADYFAYGKPVLAPCGGRVIKVVADLPDNPIGRLNQEHPWGNLVILEHPQGWYVEISHFANQSIRVKEGQLIKVGTLLGFCGNSGYSPQPHIHIQAQAQPVAGSTTLPVQFVNYNQGREFVSSGVPMEGQTLRPLWPDPKLDLMTDFVLDEEFRYAVSKKGRLKDLLRVKVGMAVDGTHYIESNRGRLYFGKTGATFYFYRLEGDDPYLLKMFLALPKMPLASESRLTWTDFLPIGLVASRFKHAVYGFLGVFYPELLTVQTRHTFIGPKTIETSLISKYPYIKKQALVELGEKGLIKHLSIEGWEMERVEGDVPAGGNPNHFEDFSPTGQREPIPSHPIPALSP